MKNAEIRQRCQVSQIEWVEIARFLRIPMKDLVRRLTEKEASKPFRKNLLRAIESIENRPESFYHNLY